MLTSTYTIVARCPHRGDLGVATSSAIPAAGAICPFVSRHGALSTQSFNNYYFGLDGQTLLAEGLAAEQVCEVLLRTDPGRELRQLLVVDAAGRAAAFTGSACISTCGHRVGYGYVVGGNMLASDAVLDAMAKRYESMDGDPLVDRLMASLEAGDVAGGDKRGKQSAAMKVVSRDNAIPLCDLRVDEHPQPTSELRRVLDVAKVQLFPFLRSMPTRSNPAGSLSRELSALLSRSVRER